MSAPVPPPAAAASTVSLVEWQHAARLPARPVSGFLPTKAPISLESVDSALEEGDRYEVSMFMDRQTSASRSVGMCVDTTVPQDGARLFEAAEWDDYDVQCTQVPCSPPLPAASKPLVEPLPSEEAIVSFCKAVDAFWSSPRNRKRHVAVVCVTGINVSGYLIVQYLVRCAKWTPERALSEFAAARPPGVYCPKMLSALLAGSPGAKKLPPPTPPAWHTMPPPPRRPPPVPLFPAAFPAAPAAGTKRRAAEVGTEPPPADGAQPPPCKRAVASGEPSADGRSAAAGGRSADLLSDHLAAGELALLERVASPVADAAQAALLWQACDASVGVSARWTRGRSLERAGLPALVTAAHLVTWRAQVNLALTTDPDHGP